MSLCEPSKISIMTDSPSEVFYVRRKAQDLGEEHKLMMEGHTVHFDGYHDQACDKKHTVILLPKGCKLSKSINTMDREVGLKEVFELLRGSMREKECVIRFFSLGPTNSKHQQPWVKKASVKRTRWLIWTFWLFHLADS